MYGLWKSEGSGYCGGNGAYMRIPRCMEVMEEMKRRILLVVVETEGEEWDYC